MRLTGLPRYSTLLFSAAYPSEFNMQYRKLGRTGLDVSLICLGTMTWGSQNSEADAHQQLDYARSRDVNFIDTAEMYPVPPQADWQGTTERYIGTWLKGRKDRDKIILATKVAGRGRDITWLRNGPALDKKNINQAIDDSLKRLQTDYVDLYQLHWPDRKTNMFGRLGYEHDANDDFNSFEESLEALQGLIKAGKVRHIGVSNETPWGTMEFLRLAGQKNLPRIASIQNPYNLLNRSFEIGLAEIAIREQCGLLAYSPLGMGTLNGKYLNGAKPEGARLTLYSRFQRYSAPHAQPAIAEYVALARKHGIDPGQMALAFVNTRPFMTANIIGASKLEQLKQNIDSVDVKLSPEVLAGIEEIYKRVGSPCP